VTEEWAAALATTYARPVAFVGVALLGVAGTALLWLALRWVGRLTRSDR
jgi:hypothetical protein